MSIVNGVMNIKVGANDGTNDGIGVNHSEMGNSLKVRNAIEGILKGEKESNITDAIKKEIYKRTFPIAPR